MPKSPHIDVTMSDELYDLIYRVSREYNLSMSSMARLIIAKAAPAYSGKVREPLDMVDG